MQIRIRTPLDLGAAIRDQRRRLGLGQRALADRVGVSRKWIVEVEKGKPSAEIGLILRTLDVLGVALVIDDGTPAVLEAETPAVDIDAIVDAARGKKSR
ncbi:MAG TPA: type II toxin-antitoxin system Y4mF family antitoxin [Thermodesulfobacteriota bacterium]